MIPNKLLKVEEFLRRNPVILPKGSGDSRRDSGEAENKILSILQNQQSNWGTKIHAPNIGKTHNRSWYDVRIGQYYCDIKVSALKSADNTNAKNAVFYFLTGRDPIVNKVNMAEKEFFKEMKQNESPHSRRDYFYIVINKNNPSDVFMVSLKGIRELQVSANNLPFQCHWSKNRKTQKRDWKEAKDFLLSCWAQGIRKKMENVKKGMPKYYPSYFVS